MSTEPDPPREASYGQILRSSSIIGGAQGLNYVVSLVRIKVVAVLLGPAGVGLIGLYQLLIGLLSTVATMGIDSSGLREVASANGRNDDMAVARTVKILRRACWVTGLVGWGVTALLAEPISHWVFGNSEHALNIAVLGGSLVLTTMTGGQMAVIQGMRRIGDMARVNVTAMVINTPITIGGYAWLGMAGIVPVLLVNSAVSLLVSLHYSRRVRVLPVKLSWSQTLSGSRSLVALGFVLMLGALLSMGADLIARAVITRHQGVDAVGFYQAAWSLSGLFAGFILGAMSADFYPRLTGAIKDPREATKLINEQIEIGLLLALPGLLAMLVFAPVAIRVFYTAEFMVAATLLPWFMLGVFGRLVSWPCVFSQLAAGKAMLFLATQALFSLILVALTLYLVPLLGVIGAAYASAIAYLVYAPMMSLVARRLVGFRWSIEAMRLLVVSATAMSLAVACVLGLSSWGSLVVGSLITTVSMMISIRGLSQRLNPSHRLMRICRRIPGSSWVMGSRGA